MSEIVYEEKKVSGVAIAALICGCVGFIINPFYLVSVAAIVLGIVGLALPNSPKGMSLAGLLTGIGSIVWQIILDTLLTIFTMGLGFFSAFI